ncbi:polyphosphate kinase 1 [Porphyromonas somerae]|uniref:polyphosphate kinase 1 n=1 Tax=Porphyromonas somerae TaxID=322095 RepID=UPI002A80C7D0|nr:polyphosphate kinase 1 [Porphyromonas somerae]MDY3885535.1 polyphosphate kinase 1 [Porphyromonas somerae]
MEGKKRRYFDRDISWLAFNKRVLQESFVKSVPIYERISFLSIFSSNLEEFYQVRVASNRMALERAIKKGDKAEVSLKRESFKALTDEVKSQEELFRQAWEEVMVPDLFEAGVKVFTHAEEFTGKIRAFVERYFEEEVFPYLQPVLVSPNLMNVFVRDKRIYLAVYVRRHSDSKKRNFMIKLPFTKAPRFLRLPDFEGRYSFTFLDEVVRAGLDKIFVGYDVLGSYSFKVSRDADIELDEGAGGNDLAEHIEEQISKRKTGAVTRLQFDDMMPAVVLEQLVQSLKLGPEVLLPSRRHLQLQDLRKLPNPIGPEYEQQYHTPIPHYRWDQCPNRLDHLLRQDEAIFVPYTSFDYLLSTLQAASTDPRVKGIKLTQYRVAEDSEVIDALIKAASQGKEVTVFVELKARFDEENNLQTAQWMIRHGVKILYSLPGLKVHAKTCFIEFHPEAVPGKCGIACFSTGNFNEKTAKIYSDVLVFTSRQELAYDLSQLFLLLEQGDTTHTFEHLLVASYGMVEQIYQLIDYEIAEARAGRKARMVLKMNSIEEQGVIDKLYEASEAGVEIDLLVRGICRVIPSQPFSQNIRVIRLLDIYLEHARIWYFYHGGEERYYVSSADWMTRNLYRRIECGAPVLAPEIKEFLGKVLDLCLSDNVKATYLSSELENIPKRDHPEKAIRTQEEMYRVVKGFNHLPPFTTCHLPEEQVKVPRLERTPRTKQSWLGQLIFGQKK